MKGRCTRSGSAELLTPEEYLAQERTAEHRSEYFNGVVVAMAGGTFEHAVIAGEIFFRLRNQLEGRPCFVFGENMKVRIDRANLFRYPDISALCGPVMLHDRERDAYCNPTLIIEVLSPSTARVDRGEKFALYRLLDSLIEYLLVAQDAPSAELFRKLPNGTWITQTFTALEDVIALESIGASLRLGDVYSKVPLAPSE